MRRVLVITALTLAATSLLACSLFDDTECASKSPFFSLSIPPGRFADRSELTPDSGLVEAEYPGYRGPDGGPDAPIWVAYGTADDWLSLPCMEACNRATDLGLLASSTTSCTPGKPVYGKPSIECHYATRECTETRY